MATKLRPFSVLAIAAEQMFGSGRDHLDEDAIIVSAAATAEDAYAYLEAHPAPDVIVIGERVPGATVVGQKLLGLASSSQLIFLVPTGRLERFKAGLPFVPTLGGASTLDARSDPATVLAIILEAASSARNRASMSAVMHRINDQLTPGVAHEEAQWRRTQQSMSERYFTTLLSKAPDAFFALDQSGRVLAQNEAAQMLFGIADELSETAVTDLVAVSEREGFRTMLNRAATGETMRFMEFALTGERSQRWAEFSLAPIADANGKITSVAATARETTDRRLAIDRLAQSEANLRDSEARLKALNADLERKVIERAQARGRSWQASPDLMGALNSEGYFETSNPAWKAVLGWTEAEVASMSIFELLHPDDVERTRDGFNLTQVGQPAIRFPNRYRCKEGGYRWISWVGVPEDGYVYCTGRDITEEKQKEEELARAQEQLRQSQKLEAMGQLTGGVAHDFNNLLTPIIGSLDLLQRRALGGEREQRLIEGALQSAERAKTLVQRLLAFARRQPLQATPVDLTTLIEGMANLIASTCGPQVELKIELPASLPPAMADANQLEMAILNLSVNARDAMPDGGKLTIGATCEDVAAGSLAQIDAGPYVRLFVTDSGTGMDAATLARVFEPFFSTKGIGKGTGLGLSMVHGLASQLGGGLTISSTPGTGTTVELWLPQSATRPNTPGVETLGDAEQRFQGEALLVDDESIVRSSTADMLLDLGYSVTECASAEEALAALRMGSRFDIIVSDHLMPGMTGADLAQEVRRSFPGIPILLISGYAEAEGVAFDTPRLTKPFRQSELAASLSLLTRSVAT